MTIDHPPALEHGDIQEILNDVFFVTGAMETVLMDADWRFSRNMTIIRDGDALTLLNVVRLDEAGLKALEALGGVRHIVRLGTLHDRDAAFYVDRYQATYWALPEMPPIPGIETVTALGGDQGLPVQNAQLFTFQTSKLPEAILRLDREDGTLIACDALQNWVAPDAYFSEATRERMEGMGFFTPANVGPVWAQFAEPQPEDFLRLKELSFQNVLCGHGEPLMGNADQAFGETFTRLFKI